MKNQLIKKDPDAGQVWRQEEKGTRWLDGITGSMDTLLTPLDMSLSKLQEMVKGREAFHAAVHGIAKSATEWLNNNNCLLFFCYMQ